MIPGFFAVAAMGASTSPWNPGDWMLQNVANTWWIRPVSVRYGDAYYVGGVTRQGEFKVFKISPTGISAFVLHTGAAGDDHSAPSITRMANGHLLAVYTRHGADSLIRYRVSANPDDISAWDSEQTITVSGAVTYSQAWVDSNDRIHLFHRITTTTWAHRYTDDNAGTWSSGKTFLSTSQRPYIATVPDSGSADVLRLAVAAHPIDASDHNIYYGEINLLTGDISQPGGAALVNLYDGSSAISPTTLETAFAAGGVNSRMFDIGAGAVPQILFATFTDTLDAEYREARRIGGSWQVSDPIAPTGPPIENPVGANYYFAGMAATSDHDSMYLVRRDATTANWVLERYAYDDPDWVLAQAVHDEDWRTYKEIFRPMVPVDARAEIPVTTLRGEYASYGTTANHTQFETDVVFDFNQVPGFSGTVLYEQSFATTTVGVAVPGWEVLTKSGTVTGEAFTTQDAESYYGGRYGQMSHSAGLAVLWGVTASDAQDVKILADMRFAQGDPGVLGLIARWVDSNNRVEVDASWFHRRLRIVERVAGTSYTTEVAIPLSISSDDSVTIEGVVVGSSISGRMYQSGVMVAEVSASAVGPVVPGKYGLKASSQTAAATTTVEVQRLLFTAP